MNKALKSELDEIFDAFFFHSSEEYAIAGQCFPVTGLMQQLYATCYLKRFRLPLDVSFGAFDPNDSLMMELTTANTTRERWEFNWKITQFLPNGNVYAQNKSQARMLRQSEYALQDPSAPPQAGAWIRAFLSKEDTHSQPGFYIVQPAIGPSVEDFQTLVRFYWNLPADSAPILLRLVTERFNAMRVPFQFKTLRYRNQYQRADSAVLFVGWRYAAIALRLAAEIYAVLKPHMKPDTPLFARQLAPGLATAEDPANGESFGMSRCRLLGQAMLNAYAQRKQSQKARHVELRALFEQAGISLDTPHLSLSTTDHYASPAEVASIFEGSSNQ